MERRKRGSGAHSGVDDASTGITPRATRGPRRPRLRPDRGRVRRDRPATNAADINRDGGIDGSDVEQFFLRWTAGC
jgi:hypothetical protein